jgi:hypothetical protein
MILEGGLFPYPAGYSRRIARPPFGQAGTRIFGKPENLYSVLPYPPIGGVIV